MLTDDDLLESQIEAEMDEQAAQVNEEAHYYSVLRDFEELVHRWGADKVMMDLDEDVDEAIWRYENGLASRHVD